VIMPDLPPGRSRFGSQATLLVKLEGNSNTVRSVVFSPDGRLLASGSEDGSVRLWSVPDRTPAGRHSEQAASSSRSLSVRMGRPWRWAAQMARFGSGAFSTGPRGAFCTAHRSGLWVCFQPGRPAAGDRELRQHGPLVEPAWRQSTGHIAGPSLSGPQCGFQPGRSAAGNGSEDRHGHLWDVAPIAGESSRAGSYWPRPHGAIDPFSPDGRLLATGSFDDNDWPVDIAQRRRIGLVAGTPHRCQRVAFSPDGRLLAAGYDDHITRLWSIPDGNLLATLRGHPSASGRSPSPDRAAAGHGRRGRHHPSSGCSPRRASPLTDVSSTRLPAAIPGCPVRSETASSTRAI